MNFAIRDGALCIQRGKDVLVSDMTGCLRTDEDGEVLVAATGAWRIVFLEKDGYAVYRVVPAREEYTLTLKL